MTKLFFSLLVGCILVEVTFAQVTPFKTTLAESQLSMQIPANFQQMEKPEDNNFVYNTSFTPNWGIVNEIDRQQFLYSFTQQTISDNDIPSTFDQLYKELQSSYKTLKIIEDGIHLTDGRNIGYIIFSGYRNKVKKAGYLFYLSVKNRLLLFAFMCDKKISQQWKTTLHAMAMSVRVVE